MPSSRAEKLSNALSIRFDDTTRKAINRRAALEMRKPSALVRQLVMQALDAEKVGMK